MERSGTNLTAGLWADFEIEEMSKADELHNAIMKVIMESMKGNNCTYADVFGALSVSKSFFEIEYAARMAATWREAMKEDVPNVEVRGCRASASPLE